jgi:hypothetical protein
MAIKRTAAVRDYCTGENRPVRERPGQIHDQALVVVQREWNGWRTGMVQLADLEDVHWSQPTGAPRPLIHAYVCCNMITSGDIPHDCQPAGSPHKVLVCLLKCHTAPCVFEELSRRADARVAFRYPRAALVLTSGDSGTHTSRVGVASLLRVSLGAIPALAAIGVIGWRRRVKRAKSTCAPRATTVADVHSDSDLKVVFA